MLVIESLISSRERLTHHDCAREPPIIDAKLDLELALTTTKILKSHNALYLNAAATKTAPRLSLLVSHPNHVGFAVNVIPAEKSF